MTTSLKSRSSVERGIDQLRAPYWVQKIVSQLAITGFLATWLIVGYLVPYQVFAQRVDTTPVMKSYMNPGVCGTGTDYACPSREYVPIPSLKSLHIAPDDPRLPESVRAQQGPSQ